MSAPFEKFTVKRVAWWRLFTMFAINCWPKPDGICFQDWETDALRFVESAIREKIERESNKDMGRVPESAA